MHRPFHTHNTHLQRHNTHIHTPTNIHTYIIVRTHFNEIDNSTLKQLCTEYEYVPLLFIFLEKIIQF